MIDIVNNEISKRSHIKKLMDFLKKEYPHTVQMFNTRNIVGDEMTNIYNDDGVFVDACLPYGYIEIFGLTDEEFKYVNKRWGR